MSPARAYAASRRHAGWLLVFSFLALLPTETLFNLPIGLMSVAGLVLLVRGFPRVRADRTVIWMISLFLCIWVPMLLSLPGAVELPHAAFSTLKYLRFPFMGIFIVHVLREPHARRSLVIAVFGLLLVWCADALVQFAVGQNLLGYPDRGNRLVGIFYPHYRLGIVLACLAPLYFETARTIARRAWGWWLLVLPLIVVVVLNGTRTGWLMFLVSSGGYLLFLYLRLGGRKPGLGTWASVSAVLFVTVLVAGNYPGLAWRARSAAGLFSGDLEAIDVATARRLSIWEPALDMLRENWLNGIGVRGFRYAFPNVAGEDNFWMRQDPPGVTHPHMLLLEIAVECGLLGVVGYVLFAALCVKYLRRRDTGAWNLSLPLALCVLVAMLPVNAHKAFYGSFWSSICWWLVFLFVAGLREIEPPAQPASNKRR